MNDSNNLEIAVSNLDFDTVKFILENDSNINFQHLNDFCINSAIYNNSIDMIKLLATHKDIDFFYNLNKYLFKSLYKEDISLLTFFLNIYNSQNKINQNQILSIFNISCSEGKLLHIKEILKYFDINKYNDVYNTAINKAFIYNHNNVVDFLWQFEKIRYFFYLDTNHKNSQLYPYLTKLNLAKKIKSF